MPMRARRYQTVEDLAADLARFRNQDPVEAYRESAVERLVRFYRRYELPILLIAGVHRDAIRAADAGAASEPVQHAGRGRR